MNKLERDGNIAVLISTGYSAGWSTWNDDYPAANLIFDKEIASALLADDNNAALAIAKKKYPSAYFGGFEQLIIVWVPKGTQFKIDEYDGYESIFLLSEIEFHTA